MTALRLIALAALLAFLTVPVRPAGGSTGLTFLTLGVGGRSLGMGEASSASTGDPAALHYNPATLTTVGRTTLAFMHRSWIGGTNADHLAGAADFGAVSLGMTVYSVSVSDIEVRDTPGPATSTFTARNAALGITVGYEFSPGFSAGLSLKYLYEKILVEDASGTAADFGALYTTPFGARIGASILNVGSMSELGSASSKLPRLFRGGASYSAPIGESPLTVTGAADLLLPLGDGSSHVHLGGEALLYESISLRAGYQTGYDARGFTAGAGFRKGIIAVDYAFIPTKYDLGSTHAFSLSFDIR